MPDMDLCTDEGFASEHVDDIGHAGQGICGVANLEYDKHFFLNCIFMHMEDQEKQHHNGGGFLHNQSFIKETLAFIRRYVKSQVLGFGTPINDRRNIVIDYTPYHSAEPICLVEGRLSGLPKILNPHMYSQGMMGILSAINMLKQVGELHKQKDDPVIEARIRSILSLTLCVTNEQLEALVQGYDQNSLSVFNYKGSHFMQTTLSMLKDHYFQRVLTILTPGEVSTHKKLWFWIKLENNKHAIRPYDGF